MSVVLMPGKSVYLNHFWSPVTPKCTKTAARSNNVLKLTTRHRKRNNPHPKMDMRQGSVLAPSGSLGGWLRLLGNKLRRSFTFIINMGRVSTEQPQVNEDEFAWLEAYKTALLEFNEQKASLAISEAMKAIEQRKRMLRFDSKHAHEWGLLEHATSTLLTIRTYRTLPSPDNTKNVAGHDAPRAA